MRTFPEQSTTRRPAGELPSRRPIFAILPPLTNTSARSRTSRAPFMLTIVPFERSKSIGWPAALIQAGEEDGAHSQIRMRSVGSVARRGRGFEQFAPGQDQVAARFGH